MYPFQIDISGKFSGKFSGKKLCQLNCPPGVPDEGDPAVLGHEGVPELVVGRSGRRLGKGRIES